MRGFTRKRGGTWTAYWDAYDADTAGRRQKSRGGFRTQKEAQTHLATVITATAGGTYVEPSKQPFARFLQDEWLPGISGTVRPLTYRNYQARVKSIVKRDIGAVPLRALSGGHLTALYGELERDGLSVGTRRFTHAVLRRALNDAVRWGKLTRNPASRRGPASPVPVQGSIVDRPRAAHLPGACRGRSALCALAARCHYRHAPRRAPRPHLAPPRPRRGASAGRTATHPD